MLTLLTMEWIFPSVFQNVRFQTSTLIGWLAAMCTFMWFHPQCELGSGFSNWYFYWNALGALVLLSSIVDLLTFPKLVINNIAYMHHSIRCLGFFKKHCREMFLSKHRIVKNIASLRKMNIAHPYNRQSAPSGPSDFIKWFQGFAPRADAMSQRLHFFDFFQSDLSNVLSNCLL